MSRAAVFVDRDGVINELVLDPASGRHESPLRPRDVALIDGSAAALRRLAAAGWHLVGVSNQPAAAKGAVSVAELEAIQARVVELLAAEDVRFDDFQLCLHHPEGVVPGLARPCDCRKPAPGMLFAAAAKLAVDPATSWMIGDTDADMNAGRAAGCRTILVENPGSRHKRPDAAASEAVVRSLAAASEIILQREE